MVKAPRTNEDKATFRYEIRNTGGKTRRTFCFALKGLPDYPVKRIRKTVTLEANSVNYVTVETTPEEMGSRFMQCFMTMEDEKDKATLTYDVETQNLYCVSNNYRYYILPTGVQVIYVGGQGSHRHTTAHCRRPIRQRHEREGVRLERQPGGWLRHSRELRQVAAGNIYRERQETVEEIIS